MRAWELELETSRAEARQAGLSLIVISILSTWVQKWNEDQTGPDQMASAKRALLAQVVLKCREGASLRGGARGREGSSPNSKLGGLTLQ
jgi:hypothetical protein